MSTFATTIATMITGLYSMAYNAYRNTSHVPDTRAKDFVRYYGDQLDEDVETILDAGKDQETALSYAQKYRALIVTWLARKSMCASAMITGPSNFPVERNRKRLKAEHAAGETFSDWRERYFKRLHAGPKVEKTNLTELERYKSELLACTQMQSLMKKVNALYPKYLKFRTLDGNPAIFAERYELDEIEIQYLRMHKPDYQTKTVVFPAWRLTNNNANMKRIEGRIKELEEKERRADMQKLSEVKTVEIPGGELRIDYVADRIIIIHPEKPSRTTIDTIKSHGFRWAYTEKYWSRKITANALHDVNNYLIPRLQTA